MLLEVTLDLFETTHLFPNFINLEEIILKKGNLDY